MADMTAAMKTNMKMTADVQGTVRKKMKMIMNPAVAEDTIAGMKRTMMKNQKMSMKMSTKMKTMMMKNMVAGLTPATKRKKMKMTMMITIEEAVDTKTKTMMKSGVREAVPVAALVP
jgi:hypothetical protein